MIPGWRLKSPEWARSNFYPRPCCSSHDPWTNGIAPCSFLCVWQFLYLYDFNLYNFWWFYCKRVYLHSNLDSLHLKTVSPKGHITIFFLVPFVTSHSPCRFVLPTFWHITVIISFALQAPEGQRKTTNIRSFLIKPLPPLSPNTSAKLFHALFQTKTDQRSILSHVITDIQHACRGFTRLNQ